MSKVILILADGMRPDGLEACGHPFLEELKAHSVYTMNAVTVMPSVTLPCHMSLFLSVPPQRHGILTNTYVPQVRPVKGLFERIRESGKTAAMYYNWGELRDLAAPDSLAKGLYESGHIYGYEKTNLTLTEAVVRDMRENMPDFIFLYLGWLDEAGHAEGWMSEEYLRALRQSVECVRNVVSCMPEDTELFFTADHGGHGRSHGTDMKEDMTIPLFAYRKNRKGREIPGAGLMDIAPTAAALLGIAPDPEWEGKEICLA